MCKIPSDVFIAMQEKRDVEVSYDEENWVTVKPKQFNQLNPFSKPNAHWRVKCHPAVEYFQNIKVSKHASASTYYEFFEAGFDAGVEHTVKENG